jgi:hypothetical protein
MMALNNGDCGDRFCKDCIEGISNGPHRERHAKAIGPPLRSLPLRFSDFIDARAGSESGVFLTAQTAKKQQRLDKDRN